MSKLTVNADVVSALQDRGLLRTDGYVLHDGFAGIYEFRKLNLFKSATADGTMSETDNNFSVECKAPKGVANLTAFALLNARLVEAPIAKESKSGKPGIFYADEIKDELQGSVPFHTAVKDSDGNINLPEKIEVVGASVPVDEDGKPLIPLRNYKYYNQVLKHHREQMNDKNAFITRQEFKDYLQVEGEKRPAGVPTSIKTLQLNAGREVTDPALWTFNLIVKDVKE